MSLVYKWWFKTARLRSDRISFQLWTCHKSKSCFCSDNTYSDPKSTLLGFSHSVWAIQYSLQCPPNLRSTELYTSNIPRRLTRRAEYAFCFVSKIFLLKTSRALTGFSRYLSVTLPQITVYPTITIFTDNAYGFISWSQVPLTLYIHN